MTDGYLGYADIVYPGKHIRNIHDKSDTFTVGEINAVIRSYIPLLRRRSRCFPKKRDAKDCLCPFCASLKCLWRSQNEIQKEPKNHVKSLFFCAGFSIICAAWSQQHYY